mmetsp:Transcript_53462/g.148143  ORF Transcript_53462/g.148143 Transcript_53462/m.148143 type:complete len:230 (+) Transcript_53462:211-900(+)
MAFEKSHSSWPGGRPQIAFLVKSCLIGPRGGSCLAGSVPLPTEMRKVTTGFMKAATSSKHLSSTLPLPFAFLKEAPPRTLEMTLGRIRILKLTILEQKESSNIGETASLSVLFSFLASTVQRIRSRVLAVLKVRCKTGARGGAGIETVGSGSLPVAVPSATSAAADVVASATKAAEEEEATAVAAVGTSAGGASPRELLPTAGGTGVGAGVGGTSPTSTPSSVRGTGSK